MEKKTEYHIQMLDNGIILQDEETAHLLGTTDEWKGGSNG